MSETITIDADVNATERNLVSKVLAFIAAPSNEEFDALALAIHRYQYRCNAPYRRFVDRERRGEPRSWREIPAVPAVAFRESALACGPAARIYESSGTTQGIGRRARHHVTHLEVYEAAALAGFQRAVLPAGERRSFIVAAPEHASHPTSSLGEMVSWLRREHDATRIPSFLLGRALDLRGLARALDALDPDTPVMVLAVTSALLRVIDTRPPGDGWRLPEGSVIVDTGGCKGYPADLPRAEILERYRDALGVPFDRVVNEYGMTEMSSQLYARGLGSMQPPPWLRTLVCDPRTGEEQPPGTVGVLRHVDLANVGSVVAVQTEDVGRATPNGFELFGRIREAEARGCSLLASA